MAAKDFRVIIVGGGPVGLLSALVLRSAGIEFIILEQRRDIVVDCGAALSLNSASLRIFHQLGLLEKALSIGCELHRRSTFTLGGHLFDSQALAYMKKNHGVSLYCYDRAELVQLLYDALSGDHDKILTEKKLKSFESDQDGVRVKCIDGTSYNGSMILGADGVHSQTRVLMRKLALDTDSGFQWTKELPFPTNYKSVIFTTPLFSPEGWFIDTQSDGRCLFYATGRDRAWVFLCETLPEQTTRPGTNSTEDISTFVSRFGEFPLTGEVKVKDVLSEATGLTMINLEEGVASQWSWGRVVLAGDACHKFTPHAGLGFNSGIQDAAVLVNELRRTLDNCPEGSSITSEQLSAAFQAYQARRLPSATVDFWVSAGIARLQSWSTRLYYLTARYILPMWIWDNAFYNYFAPNGVKYGEVLKHVTTAEEPFKGTVEWANKMTGM